MMREVGFLPALMTVMTVGHYYSESAAVEVSQRRMIVLVISSGKVRLGFQWERLWKPSTMERYSMNS